MKDLFLPLKAQFYDDFAARRKTHEYRLHGARWNETTCIIGRGIVLSRGYGKKHRMRGIITEIILAMHNELGDGLRESLSACYNLNDRYPRVIICIKIEELEKL